MNSENIAISQQKVFNAWLWIAALLGPHVPCPSNVDSVWQWLGFPNTCMLKF